MCVWCDCACWKQTHATISMVEQFNVHQGYISRTPIPVEPTENLPRGTDRRRCATPKLAHRSQPRRRCAGSELSQVAKLLRLANDDMGFPSMATPIAGWCIIYNVFFSNGWFGGTPMSGNIHLIIWRFPKMRDPQKPWVSILKLSNDLDDINIQHQHTTPICIGVVLFNIFI